MNMASRLNIGVLALQGAFAKHADMIDQLGAKAVLVRTPQELKECDALIIPGGESTTIFRQINFIGLRQPLLEFAKNRPLFGTCAGLILMSTQLINASSTEPLGIMDITVERNSFGRQIDSFSTQLEVALSKRKERIAALFIRAPRIRRCGKEVRVLASYEGEPVLVQHGIHLGASFHPELTADTLIHGYFLSVVSENRVSRGG